jgi:hypothetical protein
VDINVLRGRIVDEAALTQDAHLDKHAFSPSTSTNGLNAGNFAEPESLKLR